MHTIKKLAKNEFMDSQHIILNMTTYVMHALKENKYIVVLSQKTMLAHPEH